MSNTAYEPGRYTKVEDGTLYLKERSSDPQATPDGVTVLWQSDGTGTGSDGDILVKRNVGGTTSTARIMGGGGGGINSAVALGSGTAADPIVMASANTNAVEFRASTTATTAGSDSRGLYLRLYFDGATTGGGEAARIFSTVNAAVGTARGAHVSLNFGASGAVSGLGTASTHTLHLNAGTPTGAMAPIESEFYLETATSAPPSVHGLFWGAISGDATNKAAVKNLLYLSGVQVTAASSGVADMVTTGCADSTSDVEIKVNIAGTNYWLLATATQPSS